MPGLFQTMSSKLAPELLMAVEVLGALRLSQSPTTQGLRPRNDNSTASSPWAPMLVLPHTMAT